MTQTKEDLVESFPSMETAVFKRKIYGVCVMYGMANYKILKEKKKYFIKFIFFFF